MLKPGKWVFILGMLFQLMAWAAFSTYAIEGSAENETADKYSNFFGRATEVETVEDKAKPVEYVFHYEGLMIKDIDANDQDVFEDQLVFTNCQFLSTVQFFGTKFKKGVIFRNCTFESTVAFLEVDFEKESGPVSSLQHVSFFECIFERSVRFQNCIFSRLTLFAKCLFRDRIAFGFHAQDERKRFMTGQQASGGALTRRCKFEREVDFSQSTFEGAAAFSSVQFLQGVNFEETVFKAGADFSKAHFGSPARFARSSFFGEADFERATFQGPEQPAGVTDQAPDDSGADFYKVDFAEDVSFSKAVFLVDVGFKRARFRGRLFLGNSLFVKEANFEKASFGGEVYAAGLNEPSGHFLEMAVYRIGQACGLNGDVASGEACPCRPCVVPEEVRNQALGMANYIHNKDRRAEYRDKVEAWAKDATPKSWGGQTAYPNSESFGVLDGAIDGMGESALKLSGAQFEKAMDLRAAVLHNTDLSSKDMITVFQGPVGMADITITGLFDLRGAVFQGPLDLSGTRFIDNTSQIDLRDAVFQAKIHLPMKDLFARSGLLSRKVLLLRTFSTPPELFQGCRDDQPVEKCDRLVFPDSAEVKLDPSLEKLYQQLEGLFRSNMQLTVANELAVRAAWLKLKNKGPLDEEAISSLITFLALPIKNVLLLMALVNLLFYTCLVRRKAILGRKEERSFIPGKLPVVLLPELKAGEEIHILRCNTIWRRLVWPLFLCLGTFFALFSLGSEYVTRDKRCLRNMKTLRVAGFLLIPLLVYALAKRSEGLHQVFTLMR